MIMPSECLFIYGGKVAEDHEWEWHDIKKGIRACKKCGLMNKITNVVRIRESKWEHINSLVGVERAIAEAELDKIQDD